MPKRPVNESRVSQKPIASPKGKTWRVRERMSVHAENYKLFQNVSQNLASKKNADKRGMQRKDQNFGMQANNDMSSTCSKGVYAG